MAIVENAIETIELDYECDQCHEGKMRPIPNHCVDWSDSSQDAMFKHTCNCCGYAFSFKVKYPTLAYRKKEL